MRVALHRMSWRPLDRRNDLQAKSWKDMTEEIAVAPENAANVSSQRGKRDLISLRQLISPFLYSFFARLHHVRQAPRIPPSPPGVRSRRQSGMSLQTSQSTSAHSVP